jgi:acyl-CoA reductase-like NAD-dependent aldehyde dehydrogenase
MGAEKLTTISPTTNKPIIERTGPTDEELAALPKTAQKAFLSYRQAPLEERQTIVKKALQLINDRQDDLAKELTEQMGRPISYVKPMGVRVIECLRHLLTLPPINLVTPPKKSQQRLREENIC